MAAADPVIRADTLDGEGGSGDVPLSDLPDDELGALAYAGNDEAVAILRERLAALERR